MHIIDCNMATSHHPVDIKYTAHSRIVLLLMKCTATVQRRVLHTYLIQTGQTIQQLLTSKKKAICNTQVGHTNEKVLFPQSNQPTNIETWDLSLLCCVLSKVLQPPMKQDIKQLRELRNKICHCKNPCLDETEYQSFRTEIMKIVVQALTYVNDRHFEKETYNAIDEVEHSSLLDSVPIYIGMMNQWYALESDIRNTLGEFRQENLEEHATTQGLLTKQTHVQTETKEYATETLMLLRQTQHQVSKLTLELEALRKENTAIRTEVGEILRRIDSHSCLKPPDAVVTVETNGQRVVDDKVLEIFQSNVQQNGMCVTSTDDQWKHVENVTNDLCVDMEKRDQPVVDTEKGSVRLIIRCKTFPALASLLDECISGKLTERFKPLETAIRKLPGLEAYSQNVVMRTEDLMNVLEVLAEDLSTCKYIDDMKESSRLSVDVDPLTGDEDTQTMEDNPSVPDDRKDIQVAMSVVTLEEVENMDIMQASEWLDDHDIEYEHLVKLEEMLLLIKHHIQAEQANNAQVPYTREEGTLKDESQKKMNEILATDKEMKEKLVEIYLEIIGFVRDRVGEELRDVLKHIYQNFDDKLKEYMHELNDEECPIVVAGETSAGKSSLLNLLLGTDVLPYSLLCATSTICRLHHCEKKRFEIVFEDKDNEVHEINDEQDEKLLLKKLRDIVSSDSRQQRSCLQVEIYWPIPMLQNRVTIVDTPGVGESQDMTSRLFEYLPNAIAFIYVLNSANAGGIQDDKMLHIISEQRRWEDKGGLSSFDPNCTMFVCNKWDIVEKRGADGITWKDTVDKLKKHFPNLPEKQIFKMSTTEASRYLKSNLGYTDRYKQLLTGIEELVPASLFGKINRHFRWIGKFLDKLQSAISARINHARNTEEEKKRLHDSVLRRLNKLNMDANKVKEKLIEEAESECKAMAEYLHTYLTSDTIKTRLKQWRETDAPDIQADDFEVTKFKGDEVIMDKIKSEIQCWESENGFVKKASDRLTFKFTQECLIIGKETNHVNLLIEGEPLETGEFRNFGGRAEPTVIGDVALFSRSEKIILAIAAPLWVPIVTAASLLFLPVGVGMLIKESLQARKQRREYMDDKVRFMQEWTQSIMDTCFTREHISKFINETYFSLFKRKIEELCNDYIPKQIAADRLQVNNIANDRRTSREILNVFQPLQTGLKSILAKLRLFELNFMAKDVIDVSCLRKKKEIGDGNFSSVYLATWTDENKTTRDVALKVLKSKLDGVHMYSQLTEVECLRKLKHKNIVEYLGVCYSKTMPALHDTEGHPEEMANYKLMLLFETCECSLQDMVFENKARKCCEYRTIEDRKEAFTFYVTMAAGVCDGLAFIHDQKFLHRDLKLSNVLVKERVAKLCDFGFTRMEAALTGSFVGTMTHMSPELLDGKRYTFSTDIYSLSILLWELWYGRYVYSEYEYRTVTPHNLLEAIKTGTRPNCGLKYGMVKELVELVNQCWNASPEERPSAHDVGNKLRAIYRVYCPQ